jgi:peroxiredoxin
LVAAGGASHHREPQRGGIKTMCSCRYAWTLVIATLLATAWLGCGNGEAPSGSGEPSGGSGTNGGGSRANEGIPSVPKEGSPAGNNLVKENPPEPPNWPKVFLTDEQRKGCVVLDGDVMPDAELPALDGKPQPLAAMRGRKLTVICFWKSGETERGKLKANEILGDLQDLYAADSEKGVQVIGINEGDTPELVHKCVADAKATFPNLSDPEGGYFKKIATEKLPRVYVLDPKGKILWFDLEYSPTTRRSLKKGIQVALRET